MDAPPIQYCRTDDGVSIAYWTLGEGPAVIPMDSIGMSHVALEWDVPAMRRFYERLAQSFRVVRCDPRGTGLSDDGEISLDAYAADLAAVIDAIGDGPVALLPGGPAAQYAIPFLNRFPDQVNCLVALAPILSPNPAMMAWGAVQAGLKQPGEVLARMMDKDGVDPAEPFSRLVTVNRERVRPTVDRRREIFESWAEGEVGGVIKPTLVVDWPELDFSEGARLARMVPGARLVVRAGKSNSWYDPDPDSLTALIRDFVTEHAGDAAPPPDQADPVAAPTATSPSPHNLSPRELEVLRQIADGKSNPEIAETLVIAPGTVGRHVSNLLAKTGLKNRVEVTRYATEHGLIED